MAKQQENSLTGIVTFVSPVETVGDNGTKKQTVVIKEQKDQYPQSGSFAFIGKTVEYSEVLNLGDEVTVKFNLSNREWDGKNYLSATGYYAEVIKSAPAVEEDEDEVFDA